MKRIVNVLIWHCLVLFTLTSYAQQSTNLVRFQITYNQGTGLYSAWVVPQYSVPNANNSGAVERGATAQFTIKVPAAFVITSVTSIRGAWVVDENKLGPGNPGQDWTGYNLDSSVNYYVVGKSPSETNYGAFAAGTPVELFRFSGNGCFGLISPLEPGNPFINAATQRYSLNVANSFYSTSGQMSSGTQNPLEQFETLEGPPAQCSAIQANPDSQTLTAGTSVTIPILANDTNNGQPVSATSVVVTAATPTSGTATVNANGTITYVAAANFSGPVSFSYTICDQLQPTVCASSLVSLTVAPNTNQPVDMLITKQSSQSLTAIGTSVSFSVTVQNQGPGDAFGVVVTDTLLRNSSVALVGTPTSSQGSFNPATGLWAVGNLAAGGVATLVLTVNVLTEGVLVNTAEVSTTGGQEQNPANNTASACTSTPVRLCADSQYVASVPANYQDVRWFLNGALAGTGNSLSLSQAGVYTVTSADGACPIGGCCPIIVENGDCCPPPKCVPFIVRRSR
ncbi:hypothetical protein GCM10028807_23800 [Spirosoma daeguense]